MFDTSHLTRIRQKEGIHDPRLIRFRGKSNTIPNAFTQGKQKHWYLFYWQEVVLKYNMCGIKKADRHEKRISTSQWQEKEITKYGGIDVKSRTAYSSHDAAAHSEHGDMLPSFVY